MWWCCFREWWISRGSCSLHLAFTTSVQISYLNTHFPLIRDTFHFLCGVHSSTNYVRSYFMAKAWHKRERGVHFGKPNAGIYAQVGNRRLGVSWDILHLYHFLSNFAQNKQTEQKEHLVTRCKGTLITLSIIFAVAVDVYHNYVRYLFAHEISKKWDMHRMKLEWWQPMWR